MRARTLTIALGGLLAPAGALAALQLTVTGSPSVTVTASDLVAGPGSPLRGHVDTPSAEVLVDVSATASADDRWRLDVRRSDGVWSPSVSVWVRRTGAGSGPGELIDGLVWTEVTGTDVALFEGRGDRAGVPLQVRVADLGLGLGPALYTSQLTYTLVDLP